MASKRKIKQEGCFDRDQVNNQWNFHTCEGPFFNVTNTEQIPKDLEANYKVTGSIDKKDLQKLRIIRVAKIFGRFNPKLSIIG